MTERPGGDGEVDVDAAWAEIVARWGEGAPEPTGTTIDLTDSAAATASQAEHAPGHPPEDGENAVIDLGTTAGPGPVPGPGTPVPIARPRGRSPRPDEVAELDDDGVPVVRPEDDRPGPWAASPLVGAEPVRAAARRTSDEDDDRYIPDEPPPLPRGDLISTLAWVGALGAPLFLLVAALGWRAAPSLLIGAAVVAFAAGFVTLMVRMPDRTDDGDDGAVV